MNSAWSLILICMALSLSIMGCINLEYEKIDKIYRLYLGR